MCTDMTIDGAIWVEGQLDPFGEPRREEVGAARVAFILTTPASMDQCT